VTLCVDIGGSGVKAMRVSARGAPVSERVRVATPRPATPKAVLAAVAELVAAAGEFDRVSVGFPGVVQDGVVKTAPNLHRSWKGVDLATRVCALTGKPVRAINDAAMQGLGAIEGRGVEMCVTLGTGMGSALFVDGGCIPTELGHHPFRGKKTYEDFVGAPALEDVGKKRWSRRVAKVIARLEPTFNYRVLYLGGGNAKKVSGKLPANVRIVANVAGLLGGVRLWDPDVPAPRARRG
jgi:polyphosphate glucokinase